MFFLKRECLTIIGTAHVSANSVEEVKNTIYEQHPEIVAIELDRGRYTRLKNEMMGIEEDDTISVSKIIKEEKVGLFLATTILSYFQSKIGEDVDVKPGSEMIGAIEAAEDRLREMETGAVRGDGLVLTWDNYCDGCPCYNDGFGSGFWIEISEVEAFKAAWKIAKKEPK